MQDWNIPHYSAQTKRFYNPTRSSSAARIGLLGSLKLIYQLALARGERSPSAPLPTVTPDMAAFAAGSEQLKFIWFGHSTLLLNLDGVIILTDPIFSVSVSPFSFMFRRFQPPIAALEALPKVDIILLSHDHYDHLDRRTIRFFRHRSTRFIVPLKVGKHLRKWGIARERITQLDWFDSHRDDGLTFTAAPSRHFSGRGLSGNGSTLWASWVIEGKSQRLFFSGDSAYDSHFQAVGERFGSFDLAFIENGQYDVRWPDSHMTPEQTVQAAQDLNARVFMPIHWGMFSLAFHPWWESVARSSALATARQQAMITPRMGEIATPHQATTRWWEALERRCPVARHETQAEGE